MKRVTIDFLALLPDQPKIGDLVPSTCNQLTARQSNSLLVVTVAKLFPTFLMHSVKNGEHISVKIFIVYIEKCVS
jgi:hypothetical protein